MNRDIGMRRVLLSGAGLVSLAVATSFPDAAFAQKGSFLKPVTDWSVTKMEGSSGAYCTMARRFQYNAILTIAQNQRAESTFALDFQRPILKSRQSLEVVLDPGAGQQRTFAVSPISNQAFVAKLGYDPNFFSALKSTGYLRVTIDGQPYNFNLSDIDDGRFKLNSCVSALMPDVQREPLPAISAQEPRVAVAPSTPVTRQPADSVAPSYREADQIEQEIAALRKQVDEMAAHNKVMADKAAARQEIAKAPVAVSTPMPEPIDLIPEVIKEPVSEIAKVVPKTVLKAPNPSVNAQEVNLLAAQVNRLRQDNFKLEQRLAEAQSAANSEIGARNVKHQSQLDDLRSKNKMLQEELEAVYATQAQASVAASEVASKRERDLLALSNAQKETLNALEQEVLSLKQKNDAQAKEIVALAAQSVEVETLRQELAVLSQEKMQLEQQNATNGGQLDMVAGLQKQVMALTTQKAALAGELKVLQQGDAQDNAAFDALELENKNLKLALAQTKADMAVMAERQKSLELAAGEGNAQADALYQKELAQKTGMIDALAGENTALKDQLDQVQMLLVSQNITFVSDVAVSEVVEPAAQAVASVASVETEAFPISETVVERGGLTQAQREELEMKARMKAEQAALDTQALTPPPAPLEVRRAEDQLAGFKTVEEDGRVVDARVPDVQTVSEAAPAAGGTLYQAALPVPELLAIVNPGSRAKLVEKNSGPGQVAYQWTSNEIYGSAEQQPLRSAYQFDVKVQEYLERTQKRCPGDFAIVPDGSFEQGNVRIDSYDVACIGAGVSSSAALLFYNDAAGTFTAFAHEAPTDRLDAAIESREKIVGAVVSGS
jgi:hypothetical protein